MNAGSMFFLFAAILCLVGGIFFVWQMIQHRNARFETEAVRRRLEERYEKLRDELRDRYESLEKYRGISDVDAASQAIKEEALSVQKFRYSQATKALAKASRLQDIARSLRNIVDGYNDRYVESLQTEIDALARDYGHTTAAEDLKAARARTRNLLKWEQALDTGGHVLYEDECRQLLLSYFNERVENILKRVKQKNFGTLSQQIRDAANVVELLGEPMGGKRIRDEYLDSRVEELRLGALLHELRARDKEEQREARARIREEERVQRDLRQAQEKADREEKIAAKAIAETERRLRASSDAERQRLQLLLAEQNEALNRVLSERERARSMAEQTRRGTVYVISNVGAFGEKTFKVGLTRRLDPQERVNELGGASVPFRFDVHALIESEDAPALEAALHRALDASRVNKVNRRKEFFHTGLSEIQDAVSQTGCTDVYWTIRAEAVEYRETLAILAKEKGISPQDDLLHPARRAEDELDAILE